MYIKQWLFHYIVDKKKKVPVAPQVTCSTMNLFYRAQTKFLGIYITEKLQWNTHVQSLVNKLRKISFMIKNPKQIMSPFMIRNIYFLKFQSLLWFGILLWGRKEDNSNKEIFKMQWRVIISMIGVNTRISCKQLFKETKIFTLASLHVLEMTCFIKILSVSGAVIKILLVSGAKL